MFWTLDDIIGSHALWNVCQSAVKVINQVLKVKMLTVSVQGILFSVSFAIALKFCYGVL